MEQLPTHPCEPAGIGSHENEGTFGAGQTLAGLEVVQPTATSNSKVRIDDQSTRRR